jgi:hypothetical protein
MEVIMNKSIEKLITLHGEDRVLDLVGKGLKYERSRDKQKSSAKDRREYVKLILAKAEEMGVMEQIEAMAMEKGEEV